MSNSNSYDRNDPYSQYNFELEIDGGPIAGFSEVSGLAKQVETVTYQEGGVNDHVHELPGKSVHSNLVLKRGFTKDTKFWNWINDVMGGHIRRENIVVRMKSGDTDKSGWGWEVYDAYPVKWSGPDLTGERSGIAIESIELTYERFSGMSGMPEE